MRKHLFCYIKPQIQLKNRDLTAKNLWNSRFIAVHITYWWAGPHCEHWFCNFQVPTHTPSEFLSINTRDWNTLKAWNNVKNAHQRYNVYQPSKTASMKRTKVPKVVIKYHAHYLDMFVEYVPKPVDAQMIF